MIYRAKTYLFEYSTKWSLHYLETRKARVA